ncbi:DnaB-like helicase C-terminal domain-containing protein [Streptomyces sp. NPDC000927]|uniref:DnaB-like helicase C-terminal domain-containing protein n=1 Tax=Streptomyces sp. NPDC000927 TaxID=3154371 RepID=UPI003326415B
MKVQSPWSELNEIVSFESGQLLTVGAPTGVGRSLVAAKWACHAAVDLELPVLLFSTEREAGEVMSRCAEGRGSDEGRRLRIINSTQVTTSEIRSDVERMIEWGEKPALLVVDHIDLVESDQGGTGDVSSDLKLLAMDFEICVLATAQVSRRAESREPVPGDLRSDSAELSSDVVLFLHRDSDGAVVEGLVAKHRNGPRGLRVKLAGL